MSTTVGSCWIYWQKGVGSLKPCSSKGRINGQRASESNLGKGFSLLLATFKVYQSNGLQHFEVWQSMRQCKDLTSGKGFETQFCVSPHFLQEDLLLQVYDSSCIWAVRKCSRLHLHREVFGCCRDLAQQLGRIIHPFSRCHGGCRWVGFVPFPAGPKTTPSPQCTNHGSGMEWGYGLGLGPAPASPPCWLHQRPWSSHLHQVLLPISLLGSRFQLWRSPTFHESTSRAYSPWPSQSWLAGLRSHEGTETVRHNQRIPRFLQNKRPRTGQYGVPPAATSALHNLSGLMKAICRDSSTHLPSDKVLKDESNYETEGEKRTS